MEPRATIECEILRAEETTVAARLYLDAFAERSTVFAAKPGRAVAFVRDWMELMRRASGAGFIAARSGAELAGFLLLLMPETRLAPALLRGGFGLRLAARAFIGRYGLPLRWLPLALRRLAGKTGADWPAECRSLPHVDIILVRPDYTGQGIGAALLQRARQVSEPCYPGMSLRVDTGNHGAISLYRRIGFRVVHTQEGQHLMVWKFAGSPDLCDAHSGITHSQASPQ